MKNELVRPDTEEYKTRPQSHDEIIKDFDEVVHNSEVFDVLDSPHKVEDNLYVNMDKEQTKKYINSFNK